MEIKKLYKIQKNNYQILKAEETNDLINKLQCEIKVTENKRKKLSEETEFDGSKIFKTKRI